MTDEEAIMIARRYGRGPIIKLRGHDVAKPHEIITVNLFDKPPTVTRVDDEYPHLRVEK